MNRRASKPSRKKHQVSQRQLLDGISSNMADTERLVALTKTLITTLPRDDAPPLDLLASAKGIVESLHQLISKATLGGSDFQLMVNGGSAHALLLHQVATLLQTAIEKLEGADHEGD